MTEGHHHQRQHAHSQRNQRQRQPQAATQQMPGDRGPDKVRHPESQQNQGDAFDAGLGDGLEERPQIGEKAKWPLKIKMVASIPPTMPGRRSTLNSVAKLPTLSGRIEGSTHSCHSSARTLGTVQRIKTLRQPIRPPR